MIIRQATSRDDGDLSEIARVCGLTLRPAFERSLGHARILVAASPETPASIVGFALLWLLGDEAEVVDIGVASNYRKRGVGGSLLEELLKLARSEGAQTVYLEVRKGNQAARVLYESRGFEECGLRPKYYSDGEDAILYRSCAPGAD